MSSIADFDFTVKHAFNSWDYQYKELLERIITSGYLTDDRTGTGTVQVPAASITLNLSDGFPLLTTKRLHFRSILGELLWFVSGSTSAKELRDQYGVSIWDEWQNEHGQLGPVYGRQWRAWGEIDQLQQAVDQLQTNPSSRRIRVSAWNVADLPHMALPPCHTDFQFSVQPGRDGEPGILHTSFSMRSVDVFLGLPFNMASYALLAHMVAGVTGLTPGTLTWSGNCVHLYSNHLGYVEEQLERDTYALPRIELAPARCLDDYVPGDFTLRDYHAHPNWKNVPVAV